MNLSTHTTWKAVPPARASKFTTSSRPMTAKNAFGSIPRADVKSVPVFLSRCIASRMPWYAATHDTSEKTAARTHQPVQSWR